MPGSRKRLFVLAMMFIAPAASAAPPAWLAPGDPALRDAVERLVDDRAIDIPLLAWPIAAEELRAAIRAGRHNGSISAAHEALVAQVETAMDRNRRSWWITAGESSELRTFDDAPRENAELGARVGWQVSERVGGELALRVVSDPADAQVVRPDGSYLAARTGNWLISGGWQDRWWGGGREGSLQFSSNARPVFALSLDRETSRPFNAAWLNWLGPWTAGTFIGALEGHRPDSNHALLWGFRVAARPLAGLELSITRNAQFCGDKPPCNPRAFWNVVTGNDNAGENVAPEDEPGNQLATYEGRWAGRIARLPVSIYYQHTGETIDNKFPRPLRSLSLASIGTWGTTSSGLAWRAHLEFSTTTCSDFDDRQTADCAYENGLFTAGYRYRGRVLGHSTDSDSRQWALGFSLNRPGSSHWSATLRHAEINRLGYVPQLNHTLAKGPQTWWVGEARLSRPVWGAVLDTSLGVEYKRDDLTHDSTVEPVGYLRWTKPF